MSVKNKSHNACTALYTVLGYSFTDPDRLLQALTHCSAGSPHNERLEFLGDAILGFIISEALYQTHPLETEGGLSQMRACLVNREMLLKLARYHGIESYMIVGLGENHPSSRLSPSILSNALEAIIGAIYLDGGLEPCRTSVLRWYSAIGCDVAMMHPIKNPKSILQEWLQSRKYALPIYEVIEAGAAHALYFTATCKSPNFKHVARGVGKSRREAEQEAAIQYLDFLKCVTQDKYE